MKRILQTGMFLVIFSAFFASFALADCGSCPGDAAKSTGTQSNSCDKTKMNAKGCEPGSQKAACGEKSSGMGTKAGSDASKSEDKMKYATFSVKGMTCSGCENSVTKKLAAQDGVMDVIEVSHNSSKAVFRYDPEKANPEKLAEVVSKLGFQAKVLSIEDKISSDGSENKTM